jgi:hypothetical protein
MPDDHRAVRRTFRVGRFTCELTVPILRADGIAAATCEWSPSVPERLSDAEQAVYATELQRALVEAMEARS